MPVGWQFDGGNILRNMNFTTVCHIHHLLVENSHFVGKDEIIKKKCEFCISGDMSKVYCSH